MAVADLTYTYREPSAVRQRGDGTELLLATSGGVSETGPASHLPTAFAEPPVTSGTTNVDFNDAMRAALAGAAIRGPLLLSVGSGEVVVDVAEGPVSERKVPLPDRWLKGGQPVRPGDARRSRPRRRSQGECAVRMEREQRTCTCWSSWRRGSAPGPAFPNCQPRCRTWRRAEAAAGR